MFCEVNYIIDDKFDFYTCKEHDMRYFFTVFICKIFIFVLHLLKKQATSAPGKLAFRLYPDILKEFEKRTKKEIIAVMGTNGKTTTNNLLADCLEKCGYDVVCNRIGANMDEGSVVAYINKTNLFGKINCDYACLEMDEGWAEYILKYITPQKIIITNLFRDQLDRYGEIDTTVNFLRKAIALAPKATLFINADDPLTVAMADVFNNKKVYYGIKDKVSDYPDTSKEGKYCLKCSRELKYEFNHFSQFGKYSCECGFIRPEIDFHAENITVFPTLQMNVTNFGKIEFPVRGMYNSYNILAVLSVCDSLGINKDKVNLAIREYTPQAGRMEHFKINNKDLYLILAKNPTGFNQSVSSVNDDPRSKDVIISINDNLGDGQDVTWLWDVNFENLLKDNVKSLNTSGKRYADMALRLKYAANADISKIKLAKDLKKAINLLLETENECIYLLANYTALFEARSVIKEICNEHKN